MDAGWLARVRWRRRGAWLWPAFVALAVVDGLIVHHWPLAGFSQTVIGGIILALFANLIAIVVLSLPLGALLRRRRPDMPRVVARDYAGTVAIGFVTLALLAIGLGHHDTLVADQAALRDAIVRAEAFIGDRAPAPFRAMATHPDTYTIEAGQIYRTCVPDRTGDRTYCVIVKTDLPFAQSVTFAGYEPNAVFAQGTN